MNCLVSNHSYECCPRLIDDEDADHKNVYESYLKLVQIILHPFAGFIDQFVCFIQSEFDQWKLKLTNPNVVSY